MGQNKHNLTFHHDHSLVLNERTNTLTSDEEGCSSIVLFLNDGVQKSVLKLGGTLNEPQILPHVQKLGIAVPSLLAAGTVTIDQTNPVYAKLCDDFRERALDEDLGPDRVNYVHLEYLPGIPLARLGQGADYRSLLLQTIDILYTLNMASIRHGDIQPNNIIIHHDKAYLIDWSSAEVTNGCSSDFVQFIQLVVFYLHVIETDSEKRKMYYADNLCRREIYTSKDITVAKEKVTELVQKYV